MDFGLIVLLSVAVQGLLFGFVSAGIWRSKGGDYGQGWILGFFLSFLGLAYVAFAVPSERSEREDDSFAGTDIALVFGTLAGAMAVLIAVISTAP